MNAVNQRRDTDRELWQPRFPWAGLRACSDRALRTVGEYNEKVGHIHLNPVRAGLVSRPEDWSRPAGSSYNEYAGMSAEEQERRCGLIGCPALRDRPGENALRSACANLIGPCRRRKDAGPPLTMAGGPRYLL